MVGIAVGVIVAGICTFRTTMDEQAAEVPRILRTPSHRGPFNADGEIKSTTSSR